MTWENPAYRFGSKAIVSAILLGWLGFLLPPAAGSEGEAINRLSDADTQALNDLLTQIGRQYVPTRFSDDRDWGGVKERWDGLHVQLDGLKLKTKRRKKEVNHGTWKRFDVELLDPQQEFEVQVENIRRLPSGEVAFDLHVTSALKVHGRLSRWNRGVQIVSVSVDSRAKVRLSVSVRMDVQLDFSHVPPDVVLAPSIDSAQLELIEFEVDRFSKIGGDVAEQIGKSGRGILEDKIAEKQDKIVEKLNRSIDKRRDDLRLSLHSLLSSKWGKVAQKYLDETEAATAPSQEPPLQPLGAADSDSSSSESP